jgi:hypothetical protein
MIAYFANGWTLGISVCIVIAGGIILWWILDELIDEYCNNKHLPEDQETDATPDPDGD